MADFPITPIDAGRAPHRPVFDALPLVSWLATREGNAKAGNRAWYDFTGQTESRAAGDGWLAAIHPEDVGPVRAAWGRLVETRQPGSVEARLLRVRDSAWRWHELYLQTMPSPETDLFGVAVDVHDRRVHEEQTRLLNQASALLGSSLDPDRIYAHLRDLIAGSMVCDSLTVSIYDPADNMIRCTYAWIEGDTVDAASLPAIPLAPEGKGMQSAVIRSGEAMLVDDFEAAAANSVTVYHVDRGGRIDTEKNSSAPRTQAAILVPIRLDARVLGVTRVLSNYRKGVYTAEHVRLLEGLMSQVAAATRNAELYQRAMAEIEVRRRVEQQLLEKQAEVDLLNSRLRRAMQETHHRVKNNLQVICALIEMQVQPDQPTVPVQEFRRVGEHVRSLAALHDFLTDRAKEDADMETLSLRDAVEKLIPLLERLAVGRRLKAEVEEMRIPVRQSAALTVLINELVTNAVKHGRGDIRLSCLRENGRARLEVMDEGPGFPPGFDPHGAHGTGLELVETLGNWDLRGETRYENRAEGGARAVVLFPVTEPGTVRR